MMKIDVSYSYYFNDYCHGQNPILTVDEFGKYKAYAERFLTSVCCTARIDGVEAEVRDCVCTLAERIYTDQKTGRIKSENIDGYSVTFADNVVVRKELLEIAGLYLGRSGLVYAGVE